jgi:hypothetical protein
LKKDAVMRRLEISLLPALALCLVTMSPAWCADSPALDMVSIETRNNPSDPNSSGTYAVNRSLSARVHVTVRMESTPASYTLVDKNLSAIRYDSPKEFGVLLTPGQTRRIGLLGLSHSSTPLIPEIVTFRYAKQGAYYPRPDLHFPDTDRPEDFVRFYFYRHIPASACPIPSANPPENVHMVNIHPEKIVRLTYRNTTPTRQPTTVANLAPGEVHAGPCSNEWPNVTFGRFEFRN